MGRRIEKKVRESGGLGIGGGKGRINGGCWRVGGREGGGL